MPTRGADHKHLMMQTFDHAHRRTRTRTPNAVARRVAEAASFDVRSGQDGVRDIVGAKRGRGSSGRDDLLTERDSRRLRPRTGGKNDEIYTHDGFYARWRLGGDAEGQAEGGGGRGSQVPRRGFPK